MKHGSGPGWCPEQSSAPWELPPGKWRPHGDPWHELGTPPLNRLLTWLSPVRASRCPPLWLPGFPGAVLELTLCLETLCTSPSGVPPKIYSACKRGSPGPDLKEPRSERAESSGVERPQRRQTAAPRESRGGRLRWGPGSGLRLELKGPWGPHFGCSICKGG